LLMEFTQRVLKSRIQCPQRMSLDIWRGDELYVL
jgi:hypothetical protein